MYKFKSKFKKGQWFFIRVSYHFTVVTHSDKWFYNFIIAWEHHSPIDIVQSLDKGTWSKWPIHEAGHVWGFTWQIFKNSK